MDSSGNQISKDLSDLGNLFVSYLEDQQIKEILEQLTQFGYTDIGRILMVCKDANLINLNNYVYTESYVYNSPEFGSIKNKKELFSSINKDVRKQQKSNILNNRKTIIWIDDMWQFYPKLSNKRLIKQFRELLQNAHFYNIHFIIGSILPYRNLLVQLMRTDSSAENRNVVSELGAELIYSPDELIFFRESNNEQQEIYYPIESNLSLVDIE